MRRRLYPRRLSDMVRPMLSHSSLHTSSVGVLVLVAHPDMSLSRVNAAMVAQLRDKPGITLHDLYAHYPDFRIDVPQEQRLLCQHHVIVMQYPFYWYSAPALLKEWKDRVLERGFAFGEGGDALHGKILQLAISTGGPSGAYQPDGYNRYTIEELVRPFEQTAHLCGMHYYPPRVIQGVSQLSAASIDAYAREYGEYLRSLALRPPQAAAP